MSEDHTNIHFQAIFQIIWPGEYPFKLVVSRLGDKRYFSAHQNAYGDLWLFAYDPHVGGFVTGSPEQWISSF